MITRVGQSPLIEMKIEIYSPLGLLDMMRPLWTTSLWMCTSVEIPDYRRVYDALVAGREVAEVLDVEIMSWENAGRGLALNFESYVPRRANDQHANSNKITEVILD